MDSKNNEKGTIWLMSALTVKTRDAKISAL